MSLPLSNQENRAPVSSRRGASGCSSSSTAGHIAHLNAVLDAAHSEQHEAEQEQLRLTGRLQALMDALPAAVIVLDGSGRVTEANPAADALLAVPLKGRLWRELILELFNPLAAVDDALVLKSGQFVTLSTRPLGSEPGQVLMLQDVTDNHQLRNRLEHFRRLADMGRMAASLAHQVRTPLSSAMLYLSRLKSPRLDAQKRERLLGKAMTSMQGLERLITDMLLFANNNRSQREPVDAVELLDELSGELQQRCNAGGCRLQAAPVAGSLPVSVNRVLVKSALENLVSNAMEAGAGHIQLGAANVGHWCELSVTDDGPGIPYERQEQIFEPFHSQRPGGTGLGLAVVRAVAQAMSGEVLLHSAPGEGSRFTLRLPLTGVQQDQSSRREA